jgi:hypothetical protein
MRIYWLIESTINLPIDNKSAFRNPQSAMIGYSSNPTQCVRFSILPAFCASSILFVIQ